MTESRFTRPATVSMTPGDSFFLDNSCRPQEEHHNRFDLFSRARFATTDRGKPNYSELEGKQPYSALSVSEASNALTGNPRWRSASTAFSKASSRTRM